MYQNLFWSMEIAFVTHFSLSNTHPPQADSIGGAGVMNSNEPVKFWMLFPLQVTTELLFFSPFGNSAFCVDLKFSWLIQKFKQNLSSVCLFLPVLIVKVNASEIKRNDDTFWPKFRYRKSLAIYFLVTLTKPTLSIY